MAVATTVTLLAGVLGVLAAGTAAAHETHESHVADPSTTPTASTTASPTPSVSPTTSPTGSASASPTPTTTPTATTSPSPAPEPTATEPPADPEPSTLGPIAIAVNSRGTSYVGFEHGRGVVRLAAGGQQRRALPVPGDGPVTGLAIDERDQLWVDDGEGVSLLDRRGRLVRTFAHRPVLSCPAEGGDARRYGDLALGPGAVYVADRCRGTVAEYSRTGVLRATVVLPGGTPASSLAFLRAGQGRPDRLLVTIPDRARLLVFDATRFGDGARPLQVRKIRRVGGGKRPQPTGVVADRFGQVVVIDAANQVLQFLDGDNEFSLYRVRGVPGRGGSGVGHLRGAAALAQFPQDGSGLAGNLWVADTGNRRVQRFDVGSYTWFARTVRAPDVEPLAAEPEPCAGPVSVRVNAGEAWTRTPQVTVRVVAPRDATGLTFWRSGRGSEPGQGSAEPVSMALRDDCDYDWLLAAGDTGVRVRIDGGARDGEVLTDRIGLDTWAPRVRSASARWVRSEQRWQLRVRVVDRAGPQGTAVVARSGVSGPRTVLHAGRRNGSAGTVRVVGGRAVGYTRDDRLLDWVRVLDRAGNASDWVRVKRR